MKIKYPIAEAGKKNQYGYYYTDSEIDSIIQDFKKSKRCLEGLIVNIKSTEGIKIKGSDKVNHFTRDMYLEDGFWVADIEFVNKENFNITKYLLESGKAIFRPTIFGEVSTENMIKIVKLCSIDLVPSEPHVKNLEISWKKIK